MHATQWPFFPKDVWNLFLKIVSHLTLCSSAVHVWLTFFPKASLGVPFFQRSLVGLPFFPKVSCGTTFFPKVFCGELFFPTSFFCSNLFSKGLLFGLGTGCLGSNAASLVGQLLQLFHCVLYLLDFVGSFLKHRL